MIVRGMASRVAAVLAVLGLAGVAAPVASASIGTPSVTLSPATGTAASTANLGVDIGFSPQRSDSVKDLTLQLPPGLLADAAIDGGKCLTSTTPTSACQVGTGTVSATAYGLPVSLPTTFDLVAPPHSGDLAGLQLLASGSALGTPADVTVRPSGDPVGVGLTIGFHSIPDTYKLGPFTLAIEVDAIKSTFDNLRFPSSCPSTPARLTVTADSYSAPATPVRASAPLAVTGCSSSSPAYAPAFTVTATKDSADTGVQLVTDITQTAAQATSRSVTLAFPRTVLGPNVAAVLTGGILCTSQTLSTCKPVGTAGATSPLYPDRLSGEAYLTGSLLAPAITIVFPAPFPITLTGAVSLADNATTFSDIPDIPLTDLTVTLAGGPDAVFAYGCTAPAGTATATLTSQNGDQTRTVPSTFTVGDDVCPATPSTPPPSTSPGAPTAPQSAPVVAGRPTVSGARLTGLRAGHPALVLTAHRGTHAPLLSTVTLGLPRGLAFLAHRVHGRLTVRGLSLRGASVRSLRLVHGRLAITLRRAAATVTVRIRSTGLTETRTLRRRVRRRRTRAVTVGVVLVDAAHTSTTVRVRFTRLR